jgi:phage-related protein
VALKIGSLYVSLAADSSGLVKGLAESLKAVDKFAKEVKKAANDIAQVGMSMAAVGGAALKLASSVDGNAKRALDELGNSTRALAVPIADMLVPAVHALSEKIRLAAAWVRSLSPETRTLIAHFAEFATIAGAVGMVVGRVATIVSTLSGAFGAIASAVAGIGLAPLLGFLALVGAIAVAVPLLYQAWTENWGGIQETTAGALNNIREWWDGTVNQLKFGLAEWVNFAVRAFAALSKGVIDAKVMLGQLDERTGETIKKAIDTGVGMFRFSANDLGNSAKIAFEAAKGKASEFGDWFSSKWKAIFQSLGMNFGASLKPAAEIAENTAKKIGKIMSGALGNGAGIINASNANANIKAPTGSALQRDPNGTLGNYGATLRMDTSTSSAAEISRAFEKVRKEAEDAAAKAAAQLKGAGAVFASIIVSRLGEVGSIVQSAQQGLEKGGIWGAILAVIAELLTRMKGFTDMVAVLNVAVGKVVDRLAPLFEKIFAAVGKIVAVVIDALLPVFDALQPVFDIFADILSNLAPIFTLLGPLFKGLGTVIKAVAAVIGAVMKALKPIWDVLFAVVKVVIMVILGIVKGIFEAWNWVIGAIASVIAFFGDTAGADAFRQNNRADTTGVDEGLKALEDSSYATATAQAEATSETYRNAAANGEAADAANRATEAFTNVPTGYKIALARFNATGTDTPGAGAAGDAGGGGFGTWAGNHGGSSGKYREADGSWHVNTINVTTSDPEEFIQAVADQARKERARQRGNPIP